MSQALAPQQPLAQYIAEPDGRPHVVLMHGHPSVVLVPDSPSDQIALWDDGTLTTRSADTLAARVTEPTERLKILRRALVDLHHQAKAVARTAVNQRDLHAAVMYEIRDHAIDAYADGSIGITDLNGFLATFDLPLYDSSDHDEDDDDDDEEWDVSYEITGSHLLAQAEAAAARAATIELLRPNLSQLDNVVDDSRTHEVSAEITESLRLGTQVVGHKVTWRLTGSYQVQAPNADTATRDALGYLEVDASQLATLVPGSLQTETRVTSVD